jgi:hypothetical protein
MAGGIFPGKPFHFNIKCIIFTIIIAGGYWFLPKKNIFILAFLLWLPYVSLAWYDYSYNCEYKMQPTIFPFGRYIFLPFKPKGYQDEYKKLSKEQIEAMDKLDHIAGWTLFVIFILVLGHWYRLK